MSMNFIDAARVLADSAELLLRDLLAYEAKSIVQAMVAAYDALAPACCNRGVRRLSSAVSRRQSLPVHRRTQAAHLQQSDVLLSHDGTLSKGEGEMIDSLRRVLVYGIDYLDTLYDHIDPDVAAVLQMIAAYDALAPDWSQAPDGAQWYAIDADGVATFFDVEPEWEMFEWVIDWRSDPDAPSYPNEPLILDAPKIDVPLGVDWRLCKWQRLEVAA